MVGLRYCLLTVAVLGCHISGSAQVRLHAHNDYLQKEPLTIALRHRVYSLEADVFLQGDSLRVAHEKINLLQAPPFETLYLKPIISRFTQFKGQVSEDNGYAPVLMIDIKENGKAVLDKIVKLVAAHTAVFDRSVNPASVQLVVSGNRGPVSEWVNYPPFILFDGRPDEVYDSLTLTRVAFVSDTWYRHVQAQDSSYSRLRELVGRVHRMDKLLRIWAAPDTEDGWELQQRLGIDIINTDRVEECRAFFNR